MSKIKNCSVSVVVNYRFLGTDSERAGGASDGRGNDLIRWSTNGNDVARVSGKAKYFRQINLQKFWNFNSCFASSIDKFACLLVNRKCRDCNELYCCISDSSVTY